MALKLMSSSSSSGAQLQAEGAAAQQLMPTTMGNITYYPTVEVWKAAGSPKDSDGNKVVIGSPSSPNTLVEVGAKYQGKEITSTLQANTINELNTLISNMESYAEKSGMESPRVILKEKDADGGYRAIVIAHNDNELWVPGGIVITNPGTTQQQIIQTQTQPTGTISSTTQTPPTQAPVSSGSGIAAPPSGYYISGYWNQQPIYSPISGVGNVIYPSGYPTSPSTSGQTTSPTSSSGSLSLGTSSSAITIGNTIYYPTVDAWRAAGSPGGNDTQNIVIGNPPGTSTGTWKPDFSQPNPYAGMPSDYASRVAEGYVPTPSLPLNPVQVAALNGQTPYGSNSAITDLTPAQQQLLGVSSLNQLTTSQINALKTGQPLPTTTLPPSIGLGTIPQVPLQTTGITTHFKPDFSKSNPYEGAPLSYYQLEMSGFIPTASNPLPPSLTYLQNNPDAQLTIARPQREPQQLTQSEYERYQSSKPEEQFKILMDKGYIPKGSVYQGVDDNGQVLYLTPESVLRNQMVGLWNQRVGQLNQLNEKQGADYATQIKNFETKLKDAPKELQDAYAKGGITNYLIVAKAYEDRINQAEQSLSSYKTTDRLAGPFLTETGGIQQGKEVTNYNLQKYLLDNKNSAEALAVLNTLNFDAQGIQQAKDNADGILATVNYIDKAASANNWVAGNFGYKDLLALERASGLAGIEKSGKNDRDTWLSLSDSQKAEVAKNFANDPYKSNAFASTISTLNNITSEDVIVGLPTSMVTGVLNPLAKISISNASIAPQIKESVSYLNSNPTLSAEDTHALNDAIKTAGLKGKGIETYQKLSDTDKQKVATQFTRTQLGITPTGEEWAMSGLMAAATAIPVLKPLGLAGKIATVAEAPVGIALYGTGLQSYIRNFDRLGAEEKIVYGGMLALPTAIMVKEGASMINARIRPDVLSGSSLALSADVGREVIPKGMSDLTARQLVQDVEQLQLTGNVPASRFRSLTGTEVTSTSITKLPDGTTDIVLKSADGNVVGHVSGMQRVVADTVFHNTPNIDSLMSQVNEKGFIEVKVPGQRPGLFVSQQSADSFMFDPTGTPSPGKLAIKVSKSDISAPPRDVLDSPTLEVMRNKMFELDRTGQLEAGKVYTLFKGYGEPTHLEYELYIPQGTKLYPLDGAWYTHTRDVSPGISVIDKSIPSRTWVTSNVGFDAPTPSSVGLKVGQKVPMYWLGTKNAVSEGLTAPSLRQMYAAKLLGDLTTIRQYSPWNIRDVRNIIGEKGGAYSGNPIISAIRQVNLKSVPENTGAGRVSALIHDTEGRILLTRTLGQERYDLPGGGVVGGKGLKAGETIQSAMKRELWEELGIKSGKLEHVDTFESSFNAGGKSQKFQIFDTITRESIKPGTEVAEYIWWDGKSPLKYPVAEFAKDALTRRRASTLSNDIDIVNKVFDEVGKDPKKLEEVDRVSSELVKKSLDDAYERGYLSYKPSVEIGDYMLSASLSNLANKEPLVSNDFRKSVLESMVRGETPEVAEPTIKAVETITSERIVAERPSDLVKKSIIEERFPSEKISGTFETVVSPESGVSTEPTIKTEPPGTSEPPVISEPPITIEPSPPRPPISPEPTIPPYPPQPPHPPTPPVIDEILPTETIPPPPVKRIVGVPPKMPEEWEKTGVPKGTIEWRQGRKWVALPPPYRDEDKLYLDHPLPGTYKFSVGKGSAYRTLQVINGTGAEDANIDMGWATVHIKSKGRDLEMSFAGGQDAANDRWAMEQQYMNELEKQSYANLPQETYQERIPRYRQPMTLNKQEIPEYSTDGVKVYSINPAYIRNKYANKMIGDRKGVDWVSGGHEFVYWNIIPKNEIWVDNTLEGEDRDAVILHEIEEREQMSKGMDYSEAHNDFANKVEIAGRQRPQEINEMIASAIEKYHVEHEEKPQKNNVQKVYNNGNNSRVRQTQNNGVALPSRFYLGRKLRPVSLSG